MKRFVDLRKADVGYNFAWYDTVIDMFEQHNENQTWNSVEDFVFDYGSGPQLDRYLSLIPNWVPRQ